MVGFVLLIVGVGKGVLFGILMRGLLLNKHTPSVVIVGLLLMFCWSQRKKRRERRKRPRGSLYIPRDTPTFVSDRSTVDSTSNLSAGTYPTTKFQEFLTSSPPPPPSSRRSSTRRFTGSGHAYTQSDSSTTFALPLLPVQTMSRASSTNPLNYDSRHVSFESTRTPNQPIFEPSRSPAVATTLSSRSTSPQLLSSSVTASSLTRRASNPSQPGTPTLQTPPLSSILPISAFDTAQSLSTEAPSTTDENPGISSITVIHADPTLRTPFSPLPFESNGGLHTNTMHQTDSDVSEPPPS